MKKSDLSFASDIYAMAMTMRACITHKSPPSALKRLEKDTLRPLAETHSKYYRENVIKAIDLASNINPLDRPQNVNDLVEMMTAR